MRTKRKAIVIRDCAWNQKRQRLPETYSLTYTAELARTFDVK